MKTKNIFRMLLVAAALLMGANNVKADETQIWPASGTSNKWLGDWGNNGVGEKLTFSSDYFSSFNSGDGLKIYVSQGELTGGGTPQIQIYTINWSPIYSSSNVDGSYILIYNDKVKEGIIIQGYNLYVNSMARVSSAQQQTTTTYSITIADNIQHGSVSVYGGKTTELAEDETVTLTATPDEGYEFGAWDVKDANNNTVTVTNNQFRMPASNVTVSATFRAVQQTPTLHTGENTVWDGDYLEPLNNWENVIDLSPDMFKAANLMTNATKTVRIYGTFIEGNGNGNDGWALEIKHKTGNWSPLSVWINKNTGVICNQANGGTVDIIDLGNGIKYIEFPLSAETLASIIRDDDVLFILQGKQVSIDKVVIYVAPSVTVTAAATTNGSINYDATNTSHSAGSSYAFSVTPADGYSIGTVSIVDENGNDVSSEVHLTKGQTTNDATIYTFVVPEKNVVITATFIKISATIDDPYGATTFSCEVPVVIPTGITAYYAKQVTNSTVELLPITGGIIPAETGVVLFGDAAEYTFTMADSEGSAITGNLLRPVLNDGGALIASTSQYVLTWHDRLVFAHTSSENFAIVGYHQAYLDLDGVNAGSRLRISFGNGNEGTGIQSLQSDERSLDGAVYNLRGQRVEHPTKGIYIMNGKKVIIK